MYNKERNELKRSKKKLRDNITKLLREQKKAIREKRSRIIAEKLFSLEQFKRSETIMSYVSLSTEVETAMIIKEAWAKGKKVAVPYIDPEDRMDLKVSELDSFEQLGIGPFNIEQPTEELLRPIPVKEIDLVIVPALAFDRTNNRLGRGKGYYDRFLSGLSLHAFKAGLAFHFQILETLPKAPHDVPVDIVITD